MTRLLRPIRSGILIVAAASLLASCKDEGGVLDVFFWAEGRGDCERITVTIDMQSADALLAPPIEGRDQCDIYKALENAGCDFEVDTLTAPDRLRVTIDDCRIDDRSGLFRCAFSDGTLEDLELHTTAECDCFGSSCDETPRLCLSDNSEDEACETSVPETSSTTSSSTTTSTSFGNSTQPTMSTSTTTTFPVVAERFSVEFGIDNGAGIGAIEFDIDYAAIAGAAARSAQATLSDPNCRKLVSSAAATFEYDDPAQTIHVEMTNLPGTSGPLLLADCSFAASSEPVDSDFDVNVVAALDLEGDPIGSPPAVKVTDIEALFDLTTTTLQPQDTTTTTLPEPQEYEVTFRVDSASDEIGALQWATSYASASGGFHGSGNKVECDLLIEKLFARNDKDRVCSGNTELVCNSPSYCTPYEAGSCSVQRDELVMGVVSVEGFDAPLDLVRCAFSGTSNDPPEAGDFSMVIEDSTDSEGNPISVSMSVSIVAVP